MQSVQGLTLPMYRKTRKSAEVRARRIASMRQGRENARLARPLPDYPPIRPALRMRITVERFDCGEPIRHTFEFHDTPRVDQYRVTVNGQPWQRRIGLSRALAGIRTALPRLPSERACS